MGIIVLAIHYGCKIIGWLQSKKHEEFKGTTVTFDKPIPKGEAINFIQHCDLGSSEGDHGVEVFGKSLDDGSVKITDIKYH